MSAAPLVSPADSVEQISIEVGTDHVRELTKLKTPIRGIEELIWNALDADSTNISVKFELNPLGAIETIIVEDNGHGIDLETWRESFGRLGDSPKKNQRLTKRHKRMVHGKEGKGRFRALGLGTRAEWSTRYLNKDKEIVEGIVSCDAADPKKFHKRILRTVDAGTLIEGTIVRITNVYPTASPLLGEALITELRFRLALYLKTYEDVRISYSGTALNLDGIIEKTAQYAVMASKEDAKARKATLEIIEWKRPCERKLFICNSEGFPIGETQVRIQAPGYWFTSYLKVDGLELSPVDGDIAELMPDVNALLEEAREELRSHFKTRSLEKRAHLIDSWKKQGIYPYQASTGDPIEQARREVFDICALDINESLPEFAGAAERAKKLTFRLLRQALETNPSDLQHILAEVFALSQDAQKDLAELLTKAKLENIIKASKIVLDRLTFIQTLEFILFEYEYRKLMKERCHLHNILASEYWIFGDQYALGHSDESLCSLLKSHLHIMGRSELAAEVEDVTDLYGNPDRRPDLMLYRKSARDTEGHFEHLVIELKRPSLKISEEEIRQIEKYAFAVSKDVRFDKAKTKWVFWLIGDELDDFAQQKCEQQNRPYGLIDQKPNVDIWVKKWSTVIADCKWRYHFYRDVLEKDVTKDESKAFLAEKHSKYVPSPEKLAEELKKREEKKVKKISKRGRTKKDKSSEEESKASEGTETIAVEAADGASP